VADSEDFVGPDAEAGQDAPLSKQAAGDVRTVAKGGAVQIAGQLSQRGLASVFAAVATRVIGLGGYGLYREVSQVLTIAGQLGLAGFNYASMRFIARARAKKNHGEVRGTARIGITGAAVSSTVVVVALLLLAEPIAEAFADADTDSETLADYFRLGALYVPLFAFMQVFRYCTQAYKTMVPSVVAGNIVQPLARFILGIAAFAVGLEVAGAVGTLVLSMGVGMIAAAYMYRRILTENERVAEPKGNVGEIVRFALPQAGASLLGIQTLGLGIIILGLVGDSVQTGAFAVALSLQGPGTVFLGGIVNVWAPVVSDLYDRNAIARLGSLYQTITRWVATFSFPVFAALILEPDLFARIFVSADRVDEVAPVIAILAIGNIFYTGTGPTGYVISMTGRPGVNFINSIVSVALYVGLGLWIVPEHGAIGMAWVDTGVTVFINSIRVVEAYFLVGVQPYGRTFYKPVVATLSGAAILLAWRLIPGDSIPLEIAGVATAGVVYLFMLRMFGTDPEERHVWEQIRRRMPGRKGTQP
jgi:O-antigen/teichoic acid export membrane protein